MAEGLTRARTGTCRNLQSPCGEPVRHACTRVHAAPAEPKTRNRPTCVVAALLAELSEVDLDHLADLLAPRMAVRLSRQDDAWLRGADAIATHIGAPRSRVYALTSAKRIPVQRDGSALIARRSELDAWLRDGGAKRP